MLTKFIYTTITRLFQEKPEYFQENAEMPCNAKKREHQKGKKNRTYLAEKSGRILFEPQMRSYQHAVSTFIVNRNDYFIKVLKSFLQLAAS